MRSVWNSRRGLTFVEVMVAAGILAILTVLAVASFGPMRSRAEQVRCVGNLKSLHTSFNSYVQDKLHWPQQPETDDGLFLDEEWWLKEMEPYGAPPEIWICPAIKRVGVADDGTMPKIHYSPSIFDRRLFAPFEFATQPWLLELASPHPRGANILFPDGSVRSLDDFL